VPSRQFSPLATPLTIVVSAGYDISGGIRIFGSLSLGAKEIPFLCSQVSFFKPNATFTDLSHELRRSKESMTSDSCFVAKCLPTAEAQYNHWIRSPKAATISIFDNELQYMSRPSVP